MAAGVGERSGEVGPLVLCAVRRAAIQASGGARGSAPPPPPTGPAPPRGPWAREWATLRLEDLGEVPDDAVRTLDDAGGEAYSFAVDPDTAETQALRRDHVPLEVV